MNHLQLQSQYDKIYSYFKSTTEAFDILELDENTLTVWCNNKIIERYFLEDLETVV